VPTVPPRTKGGARLVTLSSDVGAAYAAQMKAVLARSLPPGRFLDLSHELPVHEIREAAFVVRAMARGFPAGTVHVVVVDPGVGGPRAPLVVATRDGSRLVGPDNGVLGPLAEALGGGAAHRIDPGRLTAARPRVGTTFDGRDLFAPAAALLAVGTPPARLGPRVAMRDLRLAEAHRTATGALGEIVHRDHFGNLITNVPSSWVPRGTDGMRVRLAGRPVRSLPWATSYEALGRGCPGALASSFGTVELAVAQGRADERLRAGVGVRLRLEWRARHSEAVVNSS